MTAPSDELVRVAFEVEGIPPKKDGASSLWRKRSEVERVKSLRLAAACAVAGRSPFPADVALRLGLELHLPTGRHSSLGDLDNFVTGVLDALQAASERTPWDTHPAWIGQLAEILPDRCLLLRDDAQIAEIMARRIPDDDPRAPWYRIVIEAIPGGAPAS